MNKKGFFLLFLSIIILAIFVLSITVVSEVSNRKSIQKRVETLSQFVTATEVDLERQLYIFGFRTIYLMEQDIVATHTPITNVSAIFDEAFYNGTYDGVEDELLANADLSYFTYIIAQNANRVNAEININDSTIAVTQDDPWHVKIIFITNLTAQDANNLALWNKTLTTITYVPISGFADPLHILATNGERIVNITQTPYTTFVSGSDTSNLQNHISNNYFRNATTAPTFLQRFEWDFTPSQYGIESFVNLATLPDAYLEEKTVIDYEYFNPGSNPEYCRVTPSVYSWVKLDEPTANNYGLAWPGSGCPEGGS